MLVKALGLVKTTLFKPDPEGEVQETDEDEINEDNTINDNVILDNGEVVVTSKPIKSVLQTTKKSTNKKN